MNYDLLPAHMQGGMRAYIEDKIPPGGFLRAVLANDLTGAFGRADHINVHRIRDYVDFLYNEAPSSCWGSEEKVSAWLKEGEQNGTDISVPTK